MERKPIKSRNLLTVGYDEKKQILEIEFQDHAIYRYYDVEPEIYKGLINAKPSKGSYFHSVIRDRYLDRKLRKAKKDTNE